MRELRVVVMQSRPMKGSAIALAALVLAAMPLGKANATPITTATMVASNYINVGSYTVTVNSCSLGGASDCSGIDFSTLAGNNGFVITPKTGSYLLFSNTSSQNTDISVTFEVTSPSPMLSYVGLQVAGSATGSGVAKVDETAQDLTNPFVNGPVSATGYAGGSPITLALNGAPLDDVYLKKDISVQGISQNNTTGIADITSVTETFATPEPSSVALFAVGLASLAFWKRRRA